MVGKSRQKDEGEGASVEEGRPARTDAQRNLNVLLETAKVVFASSGVDAPVREIAEKAGVGLGTVYRHFPKRSDLIAAVFRHEIDACVDAAVLFAAEQGPAEALASWMQRYAMFIATKRGMAPALHSGDPAYENLRSYFETRVRPALQSLLKEAAAAGEVRADIDADEILYAVAHLSMPVPGGDPDHAKRMVALLVDGLRYGAKRSL